MRVNFKAEHICKGCGKPRSRGYHEPCSKKMQAVGTYVESTAPRVRSPREIEHFVRRVSKL